MLMCQCGHTAVLHKDSVFIFGKKKGKEYGPVWACKTYPQCDSYTFCHKGSHKPLGFLADKETRMWRKTAHIEMDVIWKELKLMSRQDVYNKMQRTLGLTSEFHIGWCDAEQCREVVAACRSIIKGTKQMSLF